MFVFCARNVLIWPRREVEVEVEVESADSG